jgi:hypothetical protein
MHAVAAQISQLTKVTGHTIRPIAQQTVPGWQSLYIFCQCIARAARCTQAGHATR